VRNYLYVTVAAIGCWVVVEHFPWHGELVKSSASIVRIDPSVPSIVNGSRHPILEKHQDPVPLASNAESSSSSSPSIDLTRADEISKPLPRDELGRDAAKAAAEADGYRRVSILGKAGDGAWRAKGYRGATEVLLTVDSTGRVSTE